MEEAFVSWVDGRIECGAVRCVFLMIGRSLPIHRETPS